MTSLDTTPPRAAIIGPGRGRRHPFQVFAAAKRVATGLSVPITTVQHVVNAVDGRSVMPSSVVDHVAHSPEAAARVLHVGARRYRGDGDRQNVFSATRALRPQELTDALLSCPTHSILDPTPGPAGMSALAFASRSTQVAECARAFVFHLTTDGSCDPEDAWTAGLLHDIGAAVLTASRWGEAQEPGGQSVLDGVSLPSHAVIGAWLAQQWRLPPDVVRAIRWHEARQPPRGVLAPSVWLAVRVVEARLGLLDGRDLAAAGDACGIGREVLARVAMGDGLDDADGGNPLTAREAEVLELLADGLVPKQIATVLGCTVSTVHNHLHHVYRKLGVLSQVQAVLRATERGLL